MYCKELRKNREFKIKNERKSDFMKIKANKITNLNYNRCRY